MIDLHSTIVTALKTIGLPVHYEMVLHSGLATPCISYMGLTDYVQAQTDVSDIRSVSYQIKIWSNDVSDIQTYAAQIDGVMRDIDFKRTSSAELYDNIDQVYRSTLYESRS